ncbi:alpha/beta hydrolase family protein [Paenibacillus turpanensis]|uniref:alpha/beta hydrolase family protein n=1 Tax=Paenibacillus turpanensis TaxID=2689078 RepID=UPI00140AFC3B|nr:alpha/beta fold hydrolase [Paenibacillus turpanensis]
MNKHPFELPVTGDRTIRGDFYPCISGASSATIIVCHGFKGFKDWGMFPFVGKQLSIDFDTVLFNFSMNGVGASLTEFDELEKFAGNTFSRELEDLDAVVQFVREGGLLSGAEAAARPIVLLGHSRGGGLAIIYAAEHAKSVSGVISWNGTTDFRAIFPENVQREMKEAGRSWIENARTKQRMPLDVEILDDLDANAERFDIVKRAAALEVPLALIQGTNDYARLIEGSKRLKTACRNVDWLRIDGGDHTFGAKHPFVESPKPLAEAIRVTKQWVNRKVIHR